MGVASKAMSIAQQLIDAEISARKGEADVFRRLQEKNAEVEKLKRENAALVAQHTQELQTHQAEMILALEQLEADRVKQISLKDSSISELRDVVEQLTSD